jgi:O-antigen ligase
MPAHEISFLKAISLRGLLTVHAFLVALPRWLLLAVIVYAPWAYGCTRWWTKTLLAQVLVAMAVLWLCSLGLRRRLPRGPVSAAIIALCLLGLGWFSVFNSLASYDELSQVFSPLAQAVPGWFGSWDGSFSQQSMLLVTGLLGAFFVSMDLAANPIWRRRLFLTLALSGGLLLLFGLVQRATGASGIFWQPSPPSTFFATYFYHANAGAFINLTLPLVAGQTILAFKNKGQFRRAFWGFLMLSTSAAVFVNTSRASTLIGILIMAAMIIGVTVIALRQFRTLLASQVLASIVVILGCVLVLLLGFGVESSLIRWNQTLSSLIGSDGAAPWEGRLTVYRTCLLSVSAAGAFGFGPGTFSIVFPYLQQEHGGHVGGILRYAHQDYLQTLLEWGVLGFLFWVVLVGGGIVRAIVYLRSYPRSLTREHGMWIALCALSLIGVLVHSLVDFPLQIASLQLLAATLLGQLWAKLAGKGSTQMRNAEEHPLLKSRSRHARRTKRVPIGSSVRCGLPDLDRTNTQEIAERRHHGLGTTSNSFRTDRNSRETRHA